MQIVQNYTQSFAVEPPMLLIRGNKKEMEQRDDTEISHMAYYEFLTIKTMFYEKLYKFTVLIWQKLINQLNVLFFNFQTHLCW